MEGERGRGERGRGRARCVFRYLHAVAITSQLVVHPDLRLGPEPASSCAAAVRGCTPPPAAIGSDAKLASGSWCEREHANCKAKNTLPRPPVDQTGLIAATGETRDFRHLQDFDAQPSTIPSTRNGDHRTAPSPGPPPASHPLHPRPKCRIPAPTTPARNYSLRIRLPRCRGLALPHARSRRMFQSDQRRPQRPAEEPKRSL